MGKWSKDTQLLLKELEKTDPQDRLGYVAVITMCNLAIARSVNGWTSWLTDPRVMNKFDEKRLAEVSQKFKDFTSLFLGLDTEVTEIVGAKEQKPRKNDPLVI